MHQEYLRLYEHYKDNKQVMIAKIDCQAEENLC